METMFHKYLPAVVALGVVTFFRHIQYISYTYCVYFFGSEMDTLPAFWYLKLYKLLVVGIKIAEF